jgi:hypothetical protein
LATKQNQLAANLLMGMAFKKRTKHNMKMRQNLQGLQHWHG